ncbi:RidA family protein [Sorangium atrum]|uniref:RidA family protein n=1 Tax=Sorangium atrum TaxID=2995308 RepID=A0ABT5CAY8_9BACT|nr:RidA family protein [Sorangium aterium]MDC0683547.1 RidA family protein [Sorangium aterium]
MNGDLEIVQPAGWPAPRGYANGVVTRGRTLHIAGQIGWDPASGQLRSDDLAEQFAQALDNVLAVVAAAGGEPGDVARMTVYVTDLEAYRGSLRAIGAAWRARFGKHFPAMALVGVAGLVERRALVEIEAVAALDARGEGAAVEIDAAAAAPPSTGARGEGGP